MRRRQLRWSRAISLDSSSGSPRSQPSDMIKTTPLLTGIRRDHWKLKLRKVSPMRVPPAQSGTARETWVTASSILRWLSWRVIRVSLVAKRNASTCPNSPATLCMKCSSMRVYRSMEPLTSQISTRDRGLVLS